MPKRKAYLLEEKLKYVQRIKNCESQAKIVKETGIPESTLRGWKKDEDKLKEYIHTMEEPGLKKSALVMLTTLNWTNNFSTFFHSPVKKVIRYQVRYC